MDNDLISRSGAVEILRAKADTAVCTEWHMLYLNAARMIEKLPAVDAEPVRRGEWTEPYKNDIWDCYVCSICKFATDKKYIYCPNCGAKMEGEVQNEQS